MRPGTSTRNQPTGRALAALMAVIGLANLAVVSGSPWLVLLAGATAGLLGVGLIGRARLESLQVELAHPARAVAGEEQAVAVTVRNTGRRTTSECLLCLHTVGFADVTVALPRLDPGAATSLSLQRRATTRGVADGTVAHLRARPGLGLTGAMREVQVADHAVVHPVLHPVVAPPRTPGSTHDGDGRVLVAAGPEVLGPREWRAGDDRGRLHWRSTARTGRPTLLERGTVERAELRLVLVGPDDQPGFEAMLASVASTCDAALAAGTTVSAVAWHRDGPVVAPAGSRGELLDWWSAVRDTVLPHPVPFGRLLGAGFGPGAALVVGPPEADRDWLAVAAANCPGLVLRTPDGRR